MVQPTKFVVGRHAAHTLLAVIDSLLVEWPSGNQTQLKNISVNQTLKLKEEGAAFANPSSLQDFETALQKVENAPPFLHQESEFIDFDRDRHRLMANHAAGIMMPPTMMVAAPVMGK